MDEEWEYKGEGFQQEDICLEESGLKQLEALITKVSFYLSRPDPLSAKKF